MAQMKTVVIDGFEPASKRTFQYALLESAHFPQNLWAVSFSKYDEKLRESVQYTFAVQSQYATQPMFYKYGQDVSTWISIAEAQWIGKWCEVFECLWKDVPVHTHYLPDGTPLYYGLSSTPVPMSVTREYLYYVATGPLQVSWFNELRYAHVFLVDPTCCEPEFMNKMGADPNRWQLICWEHPADGFDPRTHDWYVDPDWRPNINHVFWMDEQARKRRRADLFNPLFYLFWLWHKIRRQPTK